MADPMQPHTSVAEGLGEASRKVDGVIFTHLHADHVGGIEALCESNNFKARVFTTEAQAERPNFTTSGGRNLLLETDCISLTTLHEGPLHSLDDFPGIAIIHAGGHTPGSQLVVARIGSGPTARNVVFTGDIVNQAEAIPLDRGKPLLYRTFIVPEDEVRQSSLRKFLRNLEEEHDFSSLVSHDQARLEASGLSVWPDSGTNP
jgi:glyoxylase-like metal-dependent hydrolase (beta-lactamase superfamily II)